MTYTLMAEEWSSRSALDAALDGLRYEWGESPQAQAAQAAMMAMMPEG